MLFDLRIFSYHSYLLRNFASIDFYIIQVWRERSPVLTTPSWPNLDLRFDGSERGSGGVPVCLCCPKLAAGMDKYNDMDYVVSYSTVK